MCNSSVVVGVVSLDGIVDIVVLGLLLLVLAVVLFVRGCVRCWCVFVGVSLVFVVVVVWGCGRCCSFCAVDRFGFGCFGRGCCVVLSFSSHCRFDHAHEYD